MFETIKETVTDVKRLVHSCRELGVNVKQLQESLSAVSKFQTEVQADIAKWQFKDQPRLDKIREITDRLSKKEKHN